MLAAWVWDWSPAIFSLMGREIRWYGLLFALGFFIGNYLMRYMYQKEGRDLQLLDKMILYLIVGAVVGARLGHVLFYDPIYYFAQPWKIIYVWEGGLASHGGAIGVLIATSLYCKHTKQAYLMVLDRAVIGVALAGACIRIGNFANSEVYGKPTASSYGVVFVEGATRHLSSYLKAPLQLAPAAAAAPTGLQPLRAEMRYVPPVDSAQLLESLQKRLPQLLSGTYLAQHLRLPDNFASQIQISTKPGSTRVSLLLWGVSRHPTQLYEALFYVLLFVLMLLWWRRQHLRASQLPAGSILAVFLILLWGFRFAVEFLKEPQEEFQNPFWLNMGQLLSLPLLLAGVGLLVYLMRNFAKKEANI